MSRTNLSTLPGDISKPQPQWLPPMSLHTMEDLSNALPSNQPIWEQVREVMLKGNLRSVNPYDIASVDPEGVFGFPETDKPHFIQHPALENLPSGKEAAQLILADIAKSKNGKLQLVPGVSVDRIQEVARQILLSFSEPLDSAINHALWNVKTPSLDKLHRYPPAVTEDMQEAGELLESLPSITANVFPPGSIADLHHDVGFVPSTLIEGEKLWIIYPPTASNLRVINESYKSHLKICTGHRFFKAFTKLENGIVFFQTQGTTLWVPPFCPHAVFTTKSSILLGGEIYAKHKFPQWLENLDMYVAWEQVFNRREQRDEEMDEMLEHLESVLKTDDSELRAETMKAWAAVKAIVFNELLKGTTHDRETVREVWKRGTKGWKGCPVCGDSKGESGERTRSGVLERHLAVHWS